MGQEAGGTEGALLVVRALLQRQPGAVTKQALKASCWCLACGVALRFVK